MIPYNKKNLAHLEGESIRPAPGLFNSEQYEKKKSVGDTKDTNSKIQDMNLD